MAISRARKFSVVIFDVIFTSSDPAITLLQAMTQLFARTPAVVLQTGTHTQYQSGNFKESSLGIWAGELQKQHTTVVADVSKNDDGTYAFEEGADTVTSEGVSTFMLDVERKAFLYQERGALPYTRIATYVKRAIDAAPEAFKGAVSIYLKPRTAVRGVREWIEFFTSIESVSLSYRHSQSPGNKAIDRIVTSFNAQTISNGLKAPKRRVTQ